MEIKKFLHPHAPNMHMHPFPNKNSFHLSSSSESKLATRHPYATRVNTLRAMEHIEQDQVLMREEIDGVKNKVDQIFDMMMAQARREEEQHNVASTSNVIPVQDSTHLYTQLLRQDLSESI